MSHTIEYASSRAEVWRWYWRAWARRAGLWRYHVGIGVWSAVLAWLLVPSLRDHWQTLVAVAILASIAAMILLAAVPQLRFKSERRSLTVDPAGFRTAIGTQSANVSWTGVKEIEDDGEGIVIRGLNERAMIVPLRAFADDAARRAFLDDVRTWHAAARRQ